MEFTTALSYEATKPLSKLDEFALNGFDPAIPGYYELGQADKNILKKFGRPNNTTSEIKPDKREPGLQNKYETWNYDGLVVELLTDLGDEKYRITWINKIILTSNKYRLKYGLNIGCKKKDFYKQFGNPDKVSSNSITYEVGIFSIHDDVQFYSNIDVIIEFDGEISKSITWNYDTGRRL